MYIKETIFVKASRPSKNISEGFSIKVDNPYYNCDNTLKAINKRFNKNFEPNHLFGVVLEEYPKREHTLKKNILFGKCNKKRGDFYVKEDEWLNKGMPNFELGTTINYYVVEIIEGNHNS